MSIAIIFIGTGEYKKFFPRYYASVSEKFLPKVEKHFFVFTDQPEEFSEYNDKASVQKITSEPWPYVTLKRFEYILGVAEELKTFDKIVFMDADMEVVETIIAEDIFLAGKKKLFGVQHAGYSRKVFRWIRPRPLEDNPESSAYVSSQLANQTGDYWQGCFWGGEAGMVLEMSQELAGRINQDLEKRLTARWHDESHLNKYFLQHLEQVHTLPSSYAYPIDWRWHWLLPQDKKILHLKKGSWRAH